MKAARPPVASPGPARVLGIECGGTRSVALLAGPDGYCVRRMEAGPANIRLISDRQLGTHLARFAARLLRPAAVGIGMAGVVEESERHRVRRAAAKIWPGTSCWVGNDLETALAAAGDLGTAQGAARIIVISGTGSSCYGEAAGRRGEGRDVLVGGWGHLLGDLGSGYDIGLRSLRAAIRAHDQTGLWPGLGKRLLKLLRARSANELVTWAQAARKPEIAALAPAIFSEASHGDRLARRMVAEAASALAENAVWCAARVARPGAPVQFVFTGSVLVNEPRFSGLVKRGIRERFPGAEVFPLPRESVWGAVEQARKLVLRLNGRQEQPQ